MIDDNELAVKAAESVLEGLQSYCKFLSANDSGETGGHQSGILISKNVKALFFSDKELRDNHILKKRLIILWQNDYETNCTITWYSSKNELRITGFGRGKSPLRTEYTGALFILVKIENDYYQGFILNTDDSIENFLNTFGITPAETNRIIEINRVRPDIKEKMVIDSFISNLREDFPTSAEMASAARLIQYKVFMNKHLAVEDPDSMLLMWTEGEYRLFRSLEQARYGELVSTGFTSVDDFIVLANKVLNRRKSRAGKSLEHHLAALFDENKILYSSQAITEGNKKPDFIFPSSDAYHDKSYSTRKICTLAAKTTCKDRWRQILTEADRLRDDYKYLCTMQQGVSAAQMDEMQSEKVILVVPKPYIMAYPKEKRERIWTIGRFVNYIKEIEGLI